MISAGGVAADIDLSETDAMIGHRTSTGELDYELYDTIICYKNLDVLPTDEFTAQEISSKS